MGYLHIDSSELRLESGKQHLFVAIDRVTKFTYVAFRRLCEVDQAMIASGLGGTDAHITVSSEIARLRKQLGFLIDADNFYRRLKVLTWVMGWVLGKYR